MPQTGPRTDGRTCSDFSVYVDCPHRGHQSSGINPVPGDADGAFADPRRASTTTPACSDQRAIAAAQRHLAEPSTGGNPSRRSSCPARPRRPSCCCWDADHSIVNRLRLRKLWTLSPTAGRGRERTAPRSQICRDRGARRRSASCAGSAAAPPVIEPLLVTGARNQSTRQPLAFCA